MPKRLVAYKDLYETLHFHELEARERVHGRLQVSLGLVVALTGALAFLVGSFDHAQSGLRFNVFLALLFGSSGCLFWATWHLVRAFWGNTYKEVTNAKTVREHEMELHEFYHRQPPPKLLVEGPFATAEEAFTNHFLGFVLDKCKRSMNHILSA